MNTDIQAKIIAVLVALTFPLITSAATRYAIEPAPEGFQANGQRYVDPNGSIESYSAETYTGDMTYTIRDDKGYRVRTVTLQPKSKPIDLGRLHRTRNRWEFVNAQGETYAGDGYLLMSRGVLLNRGGTVLTLIETDAVNTVALPDGFQLSALQKGDIAATRHVLILRKHENTRTFGNLLLTIKTSGDVYDAALLNIDTGNLTASFETKLRPNKNGDYTAHLQNVYYVFNTPTGPFVITLEDHYKNVVVRQLTVPMITKTVFNRDAGIAFVKAMQNQDGVVSIEASLGFSDERIDDVGRLLVADK